MLQTVLEALGIEKVKFTGSLRHPYKALMIKNKDREKTKFIPLTKFEQGLMVFWDEWQYRGQVAYYDCMNQGIEYTDDHKLSGPEFCLNMMRTLACSHDNMEMHDDGDCENGPDIWGQCIDCDKIFN